MQSMACRWTHLASRQLQPRSNVWNNSNRTLFNRSKKPRKPFFRRRGVQLTLLGAGAFTCFAIYETQPNGTFGPKTIKTLQKLPLRWSSHVWGKLTEIRFPKWINSLMISTYASIYHCNLEEMKDPIETYQTMRDFFVRRLKDDVRPFVTEGIASPVDGKIMSFQQLTPNSDNLEQVKGIEFSVSKFLGRELPQTEKNIYSCIIYLAPGDYHGVHSPVDWELRDRKYFPGYMFPVAPVAVRKLQNLLGMNERVILSGEWEHGYFSLSPVAATNVGSISLATDSAFRTNLREHKPNKHLVFDHSYVTEDSNTGIQIKRGDEVAFFYLGSTVVLIFESPPIEFTTLPGDSIKMGQTLARFTDAK